LFTHKHYTVAGWKYFPAGKDLAAQKNAKYFQKIAKNICASRVRIVFILCKSESFLANILLFIIVN